MLKTQKQGDFVKLQQRIFWWQNTFLSLPRWAYFDQVESEPSKMRASRADQREGGSTTLLCTVYTRPMGRILTKSPPPPYSPLSPPLPPSCLVKWNRSNY